MSVTGAASGAELYIGAVLTCDLITKLPVNYSWIDLTYGNSVTGPQLTIWHGGSYNCTASFDVSGPWDSVSTTIYNLTVEGKLFLWKSEMGQYNSVFLKW